MKPGKTYQKSNWKYHELRPGSRKLMQHLESKEREIAIKKELTVLKSIINNEMVKFRRSGELDSEARRFLILGQKEYQLFMEDVESYGFLVTPEESNSLGRPPLRLWGMDVVVLPAVESFVGVGTDRTVDDFSPVWFTEE